MSSHDTEADQRATRRVLVGTSDGLAEQRQYLRFGAMVATSSVVMFGLTYTSSWAVDHVRNEERFYMALLMGGAMAVTMLGFIWGMHENTKVNVAIVAGGIVLMGVALWLSRSQQFVDERGYMKGMIPLLDRDPHQRTGRHRRPARLRARQRNHPAQREEIAEMD
jgi:hypothetical protein